jgi:hypothetical protein
VEPLVPHAEALESGLRLRAGVRRSVRRLVIMDTIDFEKAKKARDEDPHRVRCAHCGKWTFFRGTKCDECGVFFAGEAFQFTHESDDYDVERARRRRRALLFVGFAVIVLVLGTFLFFQS